MEEATQALPPAKPSKPKRRLRSNAQRRRIVEETFAKGASVASVARRHDVNTNLLFNWRRLHLQGLLDSCREPGSAKLLPVRVGPGAMHGDSRERVLVTGEIELPGGIRVRLRGPVDREALSDVALVLSIR